MFVIKLKFLCIEFLVSFPSLRFHFLAKNQNGVILPRFIQPGIRYLESLDTFNGWKDGKSGKNKEKKIKNSPVLEVDLLRSNPSCLGLVFASCLGC